MAKPPYQTKKAPPKAPPKNKGIGFDPYKMAKTLTDLGYETEAGAIKAALQRSAADELAALGSIRDWTSQVEQARATGEQALSGLWTQNIQESQQAAQNIGSLFGDANNPQVQKYGGTATDLLRGLASSDQAFMSYMKPILQAQGADYAEITRRRFGQEQAEYRRQLEELGRLKPLQYQKNLMELLPMAWQREGQLFEQDLAKKNFMLQKQQFLFGKKQTLWERAQTIREFNLQKNNMKFQQKLSMLDFLRQKQNDLVQQQVALETLAQTKAMNQAEIDQIYSNIQAQQAMLGLQTQDLQNKIESDRIAIQLAQKQLNAWDVSNNLQNKYLRTRIKALEAQLRAATTNGEISPGDYPAIVSRALTTVTGIKGGPRQDVLIIRPDKALGMILHTAEVYGVERDPEFLNRLFAGFQILLTRSQAKGLWKNWRWDNKRGPILITKKKKNNLKQGYMNVIPPGYYQNPPFTTPSKPNRKPPKITPPRVSPYQ